MKFKAVPFLIATAWLIPTAASAQLPPTVWSDKQAAKPDGEVGYGRYDTNSTTPHPKAILWGASLEPGKSGNWCGTGGSHHINLPIRRPKPSVAPWDQPEYYQDARDVKQSTTWEAPTRLDRKIADEIEQAQIDYGPQDVKVAQLMWRHAQNYYNSNDYAKAKDLLRKLIDMADPEIRGKLPMKKVQAMYRDSASKMKPLAASAYKPFSYNHASHFGSTFGQYLNSPDANRTQIGRGTFAYNTSTNTPLLTAANTSRNGNSNAANSGASGANGGVRNSGSGNSGGGGSGGVLVIGPNFSFRATGPTTIKLNGVDIMIPAGASGTLNISNTPPRRSNGKPAAVKYLPLSAPNSPLRNGTRGPGTFDTGGFHDLDPGFTIHNR